MKATLPRRLCFKTRPFQETPEIDTALKLKGIFVLGVILI